MSENTTIMNPEESGLPSYLQGQERYDYSEMNRWARPPRIKLIGENSKSPFKPPFLDGDVLIVPQMVKIGDKETPFTFVPIYFFYNYLCLNPFRVGNLPMIREVSYDDNSELAKKCLKIGHTEPCPEEPKKNLTFNTVLNFLVLVEHESAPEIPTVMTFRSTSFKFGQNLIGMLQTRRGSPPPFACRFRALSMDYPHSNGTGYSFNFFNDPVPYVDQQTFERNKYLHDEMKKVVDSRQMIVDLGDEDLHAGGSGSAEDSKF